VTCLEAYAKERFANTNFRMALVGTSVSDESAFTAMVFVKICLQFSLTTHLAMCTRMKLQEENDLSSLS
jgi:hypothetical protein